MSISGQKHAPQETKVGQLELLLDLAGAISRAKGTSEIYRAATQGLVRAFVADRAAVLIFDQDDVMRFKDWVGVSDEHRAAVEGHITWERGASDPQPITVSDVMQDSSLSAHWHVFAKEGIRSLAFIPLMADGGVIGKLMLYYNAIHEFHPDEIRVVQAIASQVALATERQSAQTALRQSEERFRTTFFQAAVGITQCSPNGEWLLLNDRFCEIVGYTRAELRGKTVFDITHPDDREMCIAAVNRLMADEIPSYSAEKRYVRKDGAVIWTKLFVNAVRAPNGQMQYFIGVVEDITEKVLAERARQDSEQRLRLALSTGLGMWEYDLRSRTPTMSPQYSGVFGHRPLSHAEWLKLVHPDDRDRVMALVRGSIASGSEWDAEFRLLCPDGSVRWMLSKGTVLPGDDGPARVAGVSLDVTKRKRTEEALRLSQERLELAQEAGRFGIWDWDATTGKTYCSNGYGPLYGLPPGYLAPPLEQWLELIHSEDRVRIREDLDRAFERNEDFSSEFRVVWPDGTIHWLLGKGRVFHDSDGNSIRMAGVNMDITERKHAEADLCESEERFRNMADTAPVMIWVSGHDKLCTFFNKRWLTFTGRTIQEELGDGWASGVHPDDLDRCFAIYSSSFDARRNFEMEYRLRRADGEYRWVMDSGVPRFAPGGEFGGYIGSCIDVTELRRTQEDAHAKQKLESLGVLASGIAHDFNNILGGILTSSEIALAGRDDGSPVEEELQRIRAAAIRGGEIVRQLMIYGGEESLAFEPVDVSFIIEEMVQLLKVSISKQAVLKIDLGKNVPAVQGNSGQIRQVIMNLVTNASEAIGEHPGVIRVRTSLVRVGKDSLVEGEILPEGGYVQIEVSDTGAGMTPEVQARIFDPFFTTKFAGRGLGLAVTQRIVRSHGGAIQVNSSGQGASVQVWLPFGAEAAPQTKLAAPAEQKALSRSGRILVVEDEELLRLAVSKGLEKRGFSVMQAGDGTAAMNLIRAHASDIDVVLLDVTLPGMPSREILEEVRRIRPELRVVLTSAYGRPAVEVSLEGLQVERFIQKPFQLAELVRELQAALAD